MLIAKKIVSRLFFPLSLVILVLLLGIISRKRRRGILIVGVLLLYLFSISPVAFLLLYPLEHRYEPVRASRVDREVKWVVVLGGGSQAGEGRTAEDRLSDASLKRLLEGIRLIRTLPGALMILSGGDYRGISTSAEVMHQAALNLGVERERMIVEKASRDTRDQAMLLKTFLGSEPFYLVTSASHMVRSVRMFRKAQTSPIAAPTDFQARQPPLHPLDFVPTADALSRTDRAFYEYLGLAWGLVRGFI